MLNKEDKQSVYLRTHSQEAGFTLISLLLALSIIIMTIPFITYFLKAFSPSSYDEELAVQQFFVFIRNDALNTEEFYERNNQLFYRINDYEIASIGKYQHVIRRQVNGQGHEIYVRNIAEFETETLTHGVKLTVTTTSGERYDKTITFSTTG